LEEDTKGYEVNTIIRLPCIEEDTQFKYKRCSEIRRRSGNRYRRRSGGAIEET